MEEERMDRIQQRVREQQHHHLDVLTHSAQQAPPNEYQVEQVMETFENEEVAQERNKVEETSDSDSDRLTYYPPVFVWKYCSINTFFPSLLIVLSVRSSCHLHYLDWKIQREKL